MHKIGFIGIGNMGYHMSKNLASKGYEVSAYDTNPIAIEKIAKFNIIKTKSLKEVCSNKNIIITMLPDSNAVKNVWEKMKDYLNEGTLIVDCSTIDVETSKNLHKLMKDNNCLTLDAPVSRGTIGAEQGTLTFMVGGKEHAFKK